MGCPSVRLLCLFWKICTVGSCFDEDHRCHLVMGSDCQISDTMNDKITEFLFIIWNALPVSISLLNDSSSTRSLLRHQLFHTLDHFIDAHEYQFF
jgi:hypothetical protein